MLRLSLEALARGQEAAYLLFDELRDLKAYPHIVRQLAQLGEYPRSEVIAHLCIWHLRLSLEEPRLHDALEPIMDALARAHAVTDRVAVGEITGASLTKCLVGIADRLLKVPYGKLEFLGVGRVLAVVRNQECFRSVEKAVDAETLCGQLMGVLSPAANGVRPPTDAAELLGPEWALLWAKLVDDPNFTAAVGAFCSNQTIFLTLEDALAFDPDEVGPQLAREFAHAGKECTLISQTPNQDVGGRTPEFVPPTEPPSAAPDQLTAADLDSILASASRNREKAARLMEIDQQAERSVQHIADALAAFLATMPDAYRHEYAVAPARRTALVSSLLDLCATIREQRCDRAIELILESDFMGDRGVRRLVIHLVRLGWGGDQLGVLELLNRLDELPDKPSPHNPDEISRRDFFADLAYMLTEVLSWRNAGRWCPDREEGSRLKRELQSPPAGAPPLVRPSACARPQFNGFTGMPLTDGRPTEYQQRACALLGVDELEDPPLPTIMVANVDDPIRLNVGNLTDRQDQELAAKLGIGPREWDDLNEEQRIGRMRAADAASQPAAEQLVELRERAVTPPTGGEATPAGTPPPAAGEPALEIDLQAQALALLFQQPEWSILQITKHLKVDRRTPYKWDKFRKAAEAAGRLKPRGRKDGTPHRGHKTRDGQVEAYAHEDEDE